MRFYITKYMLGYILLFISMALVAEYASFWFCIPAFWAGSIVTKNYCDMYENDKTA